MLADSPEICTAEELADYWPGGSENRNLGRGGWTYCYASYVRILGRLEKIDLGGMDEEVTRQATLDAFREKAVPVQLVGQNDHGEPATVAVYPKSFDTLSLIDELDALCRWLAERLIWLEKQWGAEAAQKVPDAMRELTELQLTMVWIATTPGSGAPFDPATGIPDLPADFRRYDALDVILILKAHHEVNRKRISIITGSLRAGGSSGPASWATLAVGAAKALRQPIEHLMRNRSLGAWLAQAAITWDAEREAHERAQPAGSGKKVAWEEMG